MSIFKYAYIQIVIDKVCINLQYHVSTTASTIIPAIPLKIVMFKTATNDLAYYPHAPLFTNQTSWLLGKTHRQNYRSIVRFFWLVTGASTDHATGSWPQESW